MNSATAGMALTTLAPINSFHCGCEKVSDAYLGDLPSPPDEGVQFRRFLPCEHVLGSLQ